MPPQIQGKGCMTSNLLFSVCPVPLAQALARTMFSVRSVPLIPNTCKPLRRYIYLSGNIYTSQESARFTKPAARIGEPRENRLPLSWSPCWEFRLSHMIWCAVELYLGPKPGSESVTYAILRDR
jgi:hypothetical protein